MYYTTLKQLRNHGLWRRPEWDRLLGYLRKREADDEPVSFKTILEVCDLKTAIWALKTLDVPEVRLFAVRCVRQIQHLIGYESSLRALDVAEWYAVGLATAQELSAAEAATQAVEQEQRELKELGKMIAFPADYAAEDTVVARAGEWAYVVADHAARTVSELAGEAAASAAYRAAARDRSPMPIEDEVRGALRNALAWAAAWAAAGDMAQAETSWDAAQEAGSKAATTAFDKANVASDAARRVAKDLIKNVVRRTQESDFIDIFCSEA